MKGIMEIESEPGTAPSPEEAASAYQTEQEVVARIRELKDDSVEVNHLEFGRLFKQLQKLFAKSGRNGQFTKRLEELGFAHTTVYRWMDEYKRQVSHCKSESRAIPARTNKSSQMGRLGTQVQQNEGIAGSFLGDCEDASDVWLLAEPTVLEPDETPKAEKVNYLDTTEGRSEWLFKNALDVFERANKASGQALREWDAAAARVRKVLASYKKDEVDNPNAVFSPVNDREEE